jgi:hypothetical protein
MKTLFIIPLLLAASAVHAQQRLTGIKSPGA